MLLLHLIKSIKQKRISIMKKTTFTITFLLLGYLVFAQETVIFTTTKSNTKAKRDRSFNESDIRNIIKISPLSTFFGYVPIYYERAISKSFSIQGGIGFTKKNNIGDAIFKSSDETANTTISSTYPVTKIVWNEPVNNLTPDYINIYPAYGTDKRTTKTGLMFSIEPRYYFLQQGLDGAFIGFNYGRKRFDYNSKTIKTGATNNILTYDGGTFEEYDKITSYLLSLGGQRTYYRFSLEYGGAIGVKSIRGQRYAYSQYRSGTNFVDGKGILSFEKFDYDLLLKLGYNF